MPPPGKGPLIVKVLAAAYRARRGIDIVASTPDQLGTFLKAAALKWTKVVKDAA
jgi:hypothetical protein